MLSIQSMDWKNYFWKKVLTCFLYFLDDCSQMFLFKCLKQIPEPGFLEHCLKMSPVTNNLIQSQIVGSFLSG